MTDQDRPSAKSLELFIERLLFASRWLLAPLYVGLAIALVALGIKFFQESWHLMSVILVTEEKDLVLVILALIDMVLVGGLLIMVMFSGYENFVSEIDLDQRTEKLSWLGKLDAGTLKIKVAASIVAISSVHLLQAFMNVPKIPNDKLMWYVIMHMTFVISALLLGILDRMVFSGHRER